jgi:microcystin-dependent protein
MDPFIGEIKMFGGNFAPRTWAFCDGQLIQIAQNAALFSILGTTYGGDGTTTFALPDLRGRAAVHAGHGPGLTDRKLGERKGTETNTLDILQLPSHTHSATATVQVDAEVGVVNGTPNKGKPADNYLANGAGQIYTDVTPNATLGGVSATGSANVVVNPTGGGQSVNNMQPSLCINFIICTAGLFPSRN